MVDIIVLNYNDWETTGNLIEMISQYEELTHIIIVDNCSTDNSFSRLIDYATEKIHVIQTERNGGYGYGNNFGIKYAIRNFQSKYFIISNPDVFFDSQIIQVMHKYLKEHRDIQIVAPVMCDAYGNKSPYFAWKIPTAWQYSLRPAPLLSNLTKSIYYKNNTDDESSEIMVGCVAGSLFMVNSLLCRNEQLFDENLFLYCEETVLGIKVAKQKNMIVVLQEITFNHIHSLSIDKAFPSRIKKLTLLLQSRRYVLKSYYGFGSVRMSLINLLDKIIIFEYKVVNYLKKLTISLT